jgi:hypothetical protein
MGDPQNYAQHWQKVGAALREVHRKELEQMDHQASQQAIDALLQIALEHGTERKTSGLVTFHQRLNRQKP